MVRGDSRLVLLAIFAGVILGIFLLNNFVLVNYSPKLVGSSGIQQVQPGQEINDGKIVLSCGESRDLRFEKSLPWGSSVAITIPRNEIIEGMDPITQCLERARYYWFPSNYPDRLMELKDQLKEDCLEWSENVSNGYKCQRPVPKACPSDACNFFMVPPAGDVEYTCGGYGDDAYSWGVQGLESAEIDSNGDLICIFEPALIMTDEKRVYCTSCATPM